MKIALIGCTGSIGRQVLDVVRAYPEKFEISALVCGKNERQLAVLQQEFRPHVAICAQKTPLTDGMLSEIFAGCDLAFLAAGGFAGLRYTLAALDAGKPCALANKESLVCGGEIVMRKARERGAAIIPVDSEHSAIFQALSFRRDAKFSRLILTASGGPFLHLSPEALARVTPEDALRHPTWKMGPKVTIDSATLLNKGYEVIEAKWLYGADLSKIEAVVHPESIVHSLVAFEDGAMLAQLGYPDMRVPIQLALTYPERLPCAPQLDLASLGALHFERLPAERFPCFSLALAAEKEGGDRPTVLNAAAEEGVHAFLAGRIGFCGIAETIEDTLSRLPKGNAETYSDLAEADRRARETARKSIYGE